MYDYEEDVINESALDVAIDMSDRYGVAVEDAYDFACDAMEGSLAPVTNFTSWYGDGKMTSALKKAGFGTTLYPSIVVHDPSGKRVLMIMLEGEGPTPRPNIKTKIPIMWVSQYDIQHMDVIYESTKKKLRQLGYKIPSTFVDNELFHSIEKWVQSIDPEFYEVSNTPPVRARII